MRRIGTCAAGAGLAFLFLSAALLAATKSEELYDQYEKLNTPENLAKRFVGGQPYPFMEQQVKLLAELGGCGTAEAAPVVVRISDEYLARINALGPVQFELSPLKGLQIAVIELAAKHCESKAVFDRLETLLGSPLIKEYARGRALGIVARKNLAKVDPKTDPDAKERARILFDTVIGNITFSKLLHAPVRLRELFVNASDSIGGDALAVRRALTPSATSVPRRYALDFVSVDFLTRKQLRDKKLLLDEEQKLMLDVCRQWLQEYRPLVKAEKYPDDLLESTLLVLGGWKDNKALADLLVKNGVQPIPYVEPPAPPGPDQPKPPKPKPK